MCKKIVKSLSRVRLFATPWTIAHQAPLSMGFSRQEIWSGLPLPSPGDLPDPGIEPRSPVLEADTLTSEPPGTVLYLQTELPWWLRGKELACQCRRYRFSPWVWKTPWRRKWQPTPVFLPGESHGQRSLACYSP